MSAVQSSKREDGRTCTFPCVQHKLSSTLLIFPPFFCLQLNEEELQAGRDGFANPRNVAAGSARLLDPQEFARRRLSFMAYQLMLPEVRNSLVTLRGKFEGWHLAAILRCLILFL